MFLSSLSLFQQHVPLPDYLLDQRSRLNGPFPPVPEQAGERRVRPGVVEQVSGRSLSDEWPNKERSLLNDEFNNK